MRKQAVILFGPPGSGKGTQAELLARRFRFTHFDGGRVIEGLIRGSGAMHSAALRQARKDFDSGKLCDPVWWLGEAKKATARIAASGSSIVYSGSPRTLYEAFGKGRAKGLLAEIARRYGKRNVYIIELRIREATTLRRNSHRKVCAVCGLQQLPGAKHPRCLFCDGAMRTRSLDKPSVIRERLKEYAGRTYPMLREFKRRGFRVIKVNGEPAPYRVFERVVQSLGL